MGTCPTPLLAGRVMGWPPLNVAAGHARRRGRWWDVAKSCIWCVEGCPWVRRSGGPQGYKYLIKCAEAHSSLMSYVARFPCGCSKSTIAQSRCHTRMVGTQGRHLDGQGALVHGFQAASSSACSSITTAKLFKAAAASGWLALVEASSMLSARVQDRRAAFKSPCC